MTKNTVTILGATCKLGVELSFIYAKNNYNLILISRNNYKIQNLKSSLENKFPNIFIEIHELDILNLENQKEVFDKIKEVLGDKFCGLHDSMPAHSPRDAVVQCANSARSAAADLLITFGGGSVTDGGKAVTICLQHNIQDVDGLEPFRTVVDSSGKRNFPDYEAPTVRQIAIPTTLSGKIKKKYLYKKFKYKYYNNEKN